jgi:hypothetical protein
MKIKLLLLLFVLSSNIYAQETDSLLWYSFKAELDSIIQIQRINEWIPDEKDYVKFNTKKLMGFLINSPIEEEGLDYIALQYGRDSSVLVRSFVLSVLSEIIEKSNNGLCKRKAINYTLDYSFNPFVSKLLLIDFDEEAKRKIAQFLSGQHSEERINFFAETRLKYDMIKYNESYKDRIQNYIKKQKHQKEVSYEEAQDTIYQRDLLRYKEKMRNIPFYPYLTYERDVFALQCKILNAGQLNIQEAIPYLKEYANNDKYNKEIKKYAICALATMRVEDYEDRALTYFDIDSACDETWLAKIINSQKVWYAYMHGLKSQAYKGKCPVSYCTITRLGNTLKDFPVYTWIELGNGKIVYTPVPLVPDECNDTENSKTVPINPDHIKMVVGWMEANKGKYELQRTIDRTF